MASTGEKSFWKNPWTWAVGGCCLGCVAIPLILVAILGTGVFVAFTSSGFSDLKDEALARAKASSEIVEALGEPIESGWPRNSSINLSNGEGHAEMLLPLSGPKSSGVLTIEGSRRDSQWTFERLDFEPANSRDVIDLLADDTP